MTPRILIDWDDTVANLCPTWISELNKIHGTSVEISDMEEWDLSKVFPQLSRELITKPLHTEDFWKTIPIKPDALEIIPKLITEGYDVYICTATDYRNIKVKVEGLILKYFPCIDPKKIICCYNKQMICGEILIDDCFENLLGGCYTGILFSTPYNQKVALDQENFNTYRANNWKDCYALIHQLFPLN